MYDLPSSTDATTNYANELSLISSSNNRFKFQEEDSRTTVIMWFKISLSGCMARPVCCVGGVLMHACGIIWKCVCVCVCLVCVTHLENSMT